MHLASVVLEAPEKPCEFTEYSVLSLGQLGATEAISLSLIFAGFYMPASDTISVLCACGKKLKAPASAVGRRAKCPACANVLTIEAPPPPPEIAEDDPLGAMYELAETEKAAAKNNQLDDSPRCPKCAAAMANGAVLCTNCGFDARSNKKVAAAAAPAKPSPLADPRYDKKKPVDKMAPDGSFMVGLIAAFGGALLGGIVWFFVTWGTGYDICYVCMLIGIGAGVGMQIGQRGFSTMGGVASAGIALVVLLLGRLAVVLAILLPLLRTHLSHHSFGTSPNSAQAADDDDPADQPAPATPTAQTRTPSNNTPALATASASPAAHRNLSAALGGLVIFLIFFGWKSSIFMILTLGIAYRTASGSVSG